MLSQELLQRFKDGKVVFHCPTQEIFRLALDAVEAVGCCIRTDLRTAWGHHAEATGIDNEGTSCVTYANLRYYKGCYPQLEIVTLTTADFNKSAEITSVTVIENHISPMRISKVYTRAIVTKGKDGYTIELLPSPKFNLGETFVTTAGKLGKVMSTTYRDGKYTYDVRWVTRETCSNCAEESMVKIGEEFK